MSTNLPIMNPGARMPSVRRSSRAVAVSAADQLLRRIGTAERTTDPLTPRESEVVALIAQALTNRQIARRLVLSERTVETHVRHILAKLGLRTRTEIATRSLGAKPES
jgi:DNA-binding NarL/FixJ family response regulator